jgi:single-strand DNA-binding protein
MSRGLNKIILIGYLGRNPEMRFTGSGKPVTNFSMGVSSVWHDPEGERREQTEWFNIISWGGLAEVCNQYLRKGQRVYIDGRLQTRRWVDDAGVERSAVEVVAREMIMLDDSRSGPPPEEPGSGILEDLPDEQPTVSDGQS